MVSRQFVEMNRLRIEGLLAAFPKLVGHAKQHTFVETDSVRYVYQPLENQLYLLLLTTKASNIVEDLGTLRLLARLVPDVAGGFAEHAIQDHAFDLIFAFDEVLTSDGYKEEITLPAIRTNLIMDSHEEKIQIAIRENQEEEARKRMMDQANRLQQQRMLEQRNNFLGGAGQTGPSGGMVGFGGGGGGPGFDNDPFGQPGQQQQGQQQNNNDPYANLYGNSQPEVAEKPKVIAKTGMSLGGKKKGGAKNNSLMSAMAAEDNLFGGGGAGALGGNAFGLGAAPVKAPTTPSTPLTVVLEEKITVSMNREGTVESAEVKGTLTLTANTEAGSAAIVTLNKAALPPHFNYATHPKVDKKVYESQGILSMKGGKPLPVERPVGVFRWSAQGEEVAPITINCWPEADGSGTITVNIEMELVRKDVSLSDVNILLPLGTTDPPVVESIDGQYKHDPRQGLMCWHFDQVDANTNSSGSLEFSVPGNDADAFFPVQLGFTSESLMCPVQITSVTNQSNGTSIPHQLSQSFMPETYQCA